VPVQDECGRAGTSGVVADGPGVAGRGGGDAEQQVAIGRAARVLAGYLGPVLAVPVQDQRPAEGLGGLVVARRPRVASGDDGDASQLAVVSRAAGIRAGHVSPVLAVPAQDQGPPCLAVAVAADGPGGAVVEGGDPEERGSVPLPTRIRAGHARPDRAVPAQDQGAGGLAVRVVAYRPGAA